MEGVQLYVTTPGYGNTFPKELASRNIGGVSLDDLLQKSFATRGMGVVDNYQPENLAYFVYGRDLSKEGRLVSALIATNEEVAADFGGNDETFKFRYYDKIAVDPECGEDGKPIYRGNGLMGQMMNVAKVVDQEKKVPAILRTSDPTLTRKYSEMSDITTKIGDYYIYGMGFLTPERTERFKNAKLWFEIAAEHIASNPATVVPIEKTT